MEKVEDDTWQVSSRAVIEIPTYHVLPLTAPLLRNVEGQHVGGEFSFCVCVSMCSSCVSIAPRHVESGDGAVAG